MKKYMCVAGMLLLLVASHVQSQQVSTTTGNTLLQACESKDTLSDQAFCLGLIRRSVSVTSQESPTPTQRMARRFLSVRGRAEWMASPTVKSAMLSSNI